MAHLIEYFVSCIISCYARATNDHYNTKSPINIFHFVLTSYVCILFGAPGVSQKGIPYTAAMGT